MNKIRLWCAEPLVYQDNICRELILEQCCGILIDANPTTQSFFISNAASLQESKIMLNPYIHNSDYVPIVQALKQPRLYLDEPYTSSTSQQRQDSFYPLYCTTDDFSCGETFRNLVKIAGDCKHISITSYGLLIWKWRILEFLEPIKFDFVWISLNLNRNDYPALIKWAKDHDKSCWLFVDAGTSKADFISRFNQFTVAYNN